MNHAHEGSPPANQDFADSLPVDSIAVETTRWDYVYPDLGVFFVFGQSDGGAAKFQGEIYLLELESHSENDVDDEVLPGVGHQVHLHPDGTEQILLALATFCSATIP